MASSGRNSLAKLAKRLRALLGDETASDRDAVQLEAMELLNRIVRAAPAESPRAEPRPRRLWVSNQLIVAVSNDAIVHRTRSGASPASVDLVDSLRRPFRAFERDGIIEEVVAINVDESSSSASLSERIAFNVRAARSEGSHNTVNLVRLAPGASVSDVRRALEDEPSVEYVERVPLRKVPAGRRRSVRAAWHLGAIGSVAPRAADVDVAVLDTGLDESHSAISAHAYHHAGTSAEDISGHGTHVAGILAGLAGIKAGWHGVAGVKLHAWKIFGDVPNDDGDFEVDEALYQRALRAALKARCKVVNLSIGGVRASTEERRLIKDLVNAGVAVVAAMGNEYEEGNPTEFPAALAGVIAVGAVDRAFARASFSNTGEHVALVAPGVDILSTLPMTKSAARTKRETKWYAWDGTSMAAPQVAAAAAILLAQQPGADVRKLLAKKARRLAAMGTRSWTRTLGAGLLQL